MTVDYNILQATRIENVHLVDDESDGDGGYLFHYSTSTANNGVNILAVPGATAAIERAQESWTDEDMPMYIGEECGTSNVQVPGRDDVNVISFDNDDYDLDEEHGSSVLAVARSYFSRCTGTEWEYTDKDLIIRRDGDPNMKGGSVNWNYGPGAPSSGQADFETVLLHELGHACGLGHVIDRGDVMHYSVRTGTQNRSLGSNNQSAGNYMVTMCLGYPAPVVFCTSHFTKARRFQRHDPNEECEIRFGPLAIEYLIFEARLNSESSTEIKWSISSEENLESFVVEHSVDGEHFEALNQVVSEGQFYYEFVHRFTCCRSKIITG